MGGMTGKVTIGDVAKQVGVSKTTVSRYLNGKYEFMSAESQKRIQAVIEELNYRPNNLARSLRLNKSRLIGVIMADIGSPISSILVKGISDQCKSFGYQVLIANTDNDPQKEQEYILSMIDQRVEGLIVHTTGECSGFLLDIAQNHVPVVLADRPTFPTALDTVKTNDQRSTAEVIRYLAGEGFRRIAFFTETIGKVGTRILRNRAYQQTCQELCIRPQTYEIDTNDAASVEKMVGEFAGSGAGEAKAIFAGNGVVMLNILSAVDKLKLRIPRDLGICGFDDWPWAALIGPGITAIAQPSYAVGTECVNRLIYRLERNRTAKPKVIELASRLVVRGSTTIGQ